jgi:hypothetical protein
VGVIFFSQKNVQLVQQKILTIKKPPMAESRGNDMEKYFKETLKLYKDFKGLENRLNKEYEDALESHNYSKQYLNTMKKNNVAKIDKERKTINDRFSLVKKELTKDLESRYDVETGFISEKLVKLLQSGIQLTPREYSRLGERHKSNLAESRLLHDVAKKNGFTLENFVPFEEVLKRFDTHIERLQKSMWESRGQIPFYTSIQEAELQSGVLCGETMKCSFECYKTPETLEQKIAHDIKAERGKEIEELDEKSFVTGFTGKEPEESAADNILTTEEKEDAKLRSKMQGRNGVIDETDVEYIRHSTDYQEVLEHRENEKANNKMQGQLPEGK